VSVTEPTIIF